QRFVAVGERLLQLATCNRARIAAIIKGPSKLGLDPDRLAIVRNRAVVVLSGLIRMAAILEGNDIPGSESERHCVVRNRTVVILLVKICATTTVDCEDIIGFDPDRLGVVRDCVVVVALGTIRAAANSKSGSEISAGLLARLDHCRAAADYLIWLCTAFDVTPGPLLSRLCASRSC